MPKEYKDALYDKIVNTNKSQLNIKTSIWADTFMSHMPYIFSKHKKLHGCLDSSFLSKIEECVTQLADFYRNSVHSRVPILYKTSTEFAILRTQEERMRIDGHPFVVCIHLEKAQESWTFCASNSTKALKDRLNLAYRMTKNCELEDLI